MFKYLNFEVLLIAVFVGLIGFTSVQGVKNEFNVLGYLSENPESWDSMVPVGNVIGYDKFEVAMSSHPAHQMNKAKYDRLYFSGNTSGQYNYLFETGDRFPIGSELRVYRGKGVTAFCRKTNNLNRLDCKVTKIKRKR